MLDINVDISDVIKEFDLLVSESQNLSSQILDRLVDEYDTRLKAIVSNELGKTKNEYLSAIEVDRVNAYTAVIRLTSRQSNLPLMIEEGAPPFDIKEGLKKSSKKKSGLGGGWYIDVPFRFATGAAQGFSPAFNAGVAPSSVINKAKKAAGKAVTASNLPEKYKNPVIRRATANKIDGVFRTTQSYQHKSSIYSGIRRKETGTSKKKSGEYRTFRRVSENSDPASWFHHGFVAKKFMDRTLETLEVDVIVDNEIQKFLNTL